MRLVKRPANQCADVRDAHGECLERAPWRHLDEMWRQRSLRSCRSARGPYLTVEVASCCGVACLEAVVQTTRPLAPDPHRVDTTYAIAGRKNTQQWRPPLI
jgi:hypothetical protein